MDDSEKMFPRSYKERFKESIYDYAPSCLIKGGLFLTISLIVLLVYILVSSTQTSLKREIPQSVVKIYINNNDSLIPIIRLELDSIKNQLNNIRNDSVTVSISKNQKK